MQKNIVYLFVFETLADWEYEYAVAGINNPQFQKNANRYKIVTVGATTEAISHRARLVAIVRYKGQHLGVAVVSRT